MKQSARFENPGFRRPAIYYDTPIVFYHGAGFVPGWNCLAEEAGTGRGRTAAFTAGQVAVYATVKDTGQGLSGRTPAG